MLQDRGFHSRPSAWQHWRVRRKFSAPRKLVVGSATLQDAISYGLPGSYRIALPPAIAVRARDTPTRSTRTCACRTSRRGVCVLRFHHRRRPRTETTADRCGCLGFTSVGSDREGHPSVAPQRPRVRRRASSLGRTLPNPSNRARRSRDGHPRCVRIEMGQLPPLLRRPRAPRSILDAASPINRHLP
jgi:hypothetical protein